MAPNRSLYTWRPLVLDAATAHQTGAIRYEADGTAWLTCEELGESVRIAPAQQYPCTFPTFLALDKSLSSSSNSPRLRSGRTLRETFDIEYQR
ncbi:MAG: hypothetical protein RL685_4534, partial [Pseudomonadota bacterium]